MISRAMGAREPGPQGERAISFETIAQGRPECFRLYLWSARTRNIFSARGLRVQRASGLPCALRLFEGDACEQLGRSMPRECALMSCAVIPGRAFRSPELSPTMSVSVGRDVCSSSWPGLSRPSTSLMCGKDETWMPRHKAGHDEAVEAAQCTACTRPVARMPICDGPGRTRVYAGSACHIGASKPQPFSALNWDRLARQCGWRKNRRN
jgi:hypothetical protein